MNRQLTPEAHMKTTYRSGFLPKIQQKLKDTQSIFQSLDADKVRPRNFDFSNLQRTTATAKPRSRSNQRTQLTPITAALGSKQITKMYLNRLIQTLMKQLQSDIELASSCKQLSACSQKLMNLFLMLSPPYSDGFDTVSGKLKRDLATLKSDNLELTDRDLSTPYLIELDRMNQCIQFLDIRVQHRHLLLLAKLTNSLYNDLSFGMVVQYQSLFNIIQQTLSTMKNMSSQHELSTTTASDQEDEKVTTSAKMIQRILTRSSHRKVQFKIKKIGYLNEQNVVAYYDAYQDLKKRLGREWNAKNYVFGCIRIGVVDLQRYPHYHDESSLKQFKIFGLERSKMPMFLQFVFKHKSQPTLEIPLTKIPFNNPQQSTTRDDGRLFIEQLLYCNSFSLANDFIKIYQENNIPLNQIDISLSKELIIKPQRQDDSESTCPPIFDHEQQYNCKKKDYDPDEIFIGESSDSENEPPIYMPLFVKSIQSYPQVLLGLQIQTYFPFFYRYQYSKLFNTFEFLSEEYNDYKIKPAYQFKENFLVFPSCDNSNFQRHVHKNPDTLDQTDESDNEFYENPLEALDKEDLSLSFQIQPLEKQFDEKNQTQYLKSQSSVIIQDEYKVSNNIQFQHNYAQPFICFQDSYSLMTEKRFPLNINFHIITSEVEKEIPLKEVTIDANTIIIDNTLTFDQSTKYLDTAPINFAESEEEPSFDEQPLEVEIPEKNEQLQQDIHEEDDEELSLDKIQEIIDLEIKENLTIEVKGEYVSKLVVDNKPVNFFLEERFRLLEPMKFSINMEGKEIKSMQVSIEQRGSKSYLKSCAMIAQVDQRFEQDNRKSQENDQEDQIIIYDTPQLPDDWNHGQFRILLCHPERFESIDDVEWLKKTLGKIFKNIQIDEDFSEGFEAYIFGVGPVSQRDGSDRLLLYKKDTESWEVFNQSFRYLIFQLYQTICCIISIYGSTKLMGEAQMRYTRTNFKNHQHPYKYVDNRPQTGYRYRKQ